MESWRSDAVGDDEIKNLAKMVVDFNRERGLRDADDDDLLQIVLTAFVAGKKSGSQATIEFLTKRSPVQ